MTLFLFKSLYCEGFTFLAGKCELASTRGSSEGFFYNCEIRFPLTSRCPELTLYQNTPSTLSPRLPVGLFPCGNLEHLSSNQPATEPLTSVCPSFSRSTSSVIHALSVCLSCLSACLSCRGANSRHACWMLVWYQQSGQAGRQSPHAATDETWGWSKLFKQLYGACHPKNKIA